MISVVIPNYNGGNVVRRAIDSVIAQETPDIEIIVVDDCSTDASCDVVRSYGTKMRLIALPNNLRVNGARHAGLDACRHNCVMFRDNDDYLLPGKTLAISQITDRISENLTFRGQLEAEPSLAARIAHSSLVEVQ